MIRLEKYGPVLDPTIELVEELANTGSAELRVPDHPKAVGMAADVETFTHDIYPFIDWTLHFAKKSQTLFLDGKSDSKAKRVKAALVICDDEFSEDLDTGFASTTVDIAECDKPGDFKSKVNFTARETPEPYKQVRANRLVGLLRKNGIMLPYEKRRITLFGFFQSVSEKPFNTVFQDMDPISQYVKPNGTIRYDYTVSGKQRHELSLGAYRMFQAPIFWTSWSQFGVHALRKMSEEMDYDTAVMRYKADNIRRHAPRAEKYVVELIRALKEGDDLTYLAQRVGCPHEYEDFYFRKILSGIAWLCNPASLTDPVKKGYLENLTKACGEYDFRTTPEELASLPSREKRLAAAY